MDHPSIYKNNRIYICIDFTSCMCSKTLKGCVMDHLKVNLHSCTVHKTRAIINRLHILFHFIAILGLLYYRLSHLLLAGDIPILAWVLMTTSEFILTLIWALTQAFRWLPVTREAYPENILTKEIAFPGIDVFVCTADPKKEPTVEVMNTVVSAMALDYPPEKLAVYLSDDGGSSLTLYAIKEACMFARTWLPFCRGYGIKTRCPEVYFSAYGDDERLLHGSDDEFKAEEEQMKSAYELFKKNVEKGNGLNGREDGAVNDRPPCVEVIHDNTKDGQNEDEHTNMPLLVYVSREIRPSHPHRFKAGALNTLLRVSGIMSNAPYLLVLDCDMFCNDPTSAKQAMCFHLDPNMSQSLSFVQYPQMFYNIGKDDIYDGQARSAFKTKWQGMDGLSGPVFTGTGYYLKKKALYGSPNQKDEFLVEPKKNFGQSMKFIASLKSCNYEQDHINGKGAISDEILEEARNLASCSFEKNTNWGKDIGYTYESLLESTFTGYFLHCKGWKSVYLYPKRPCFLGSTPIDMKDALVQVVKWSSGCLQVGLSRFSPLVYGMSRMSILQSLCYGYFTLFPLASIAFLIYAIVPQLCLWNAIPLFPKVSDPWFAPFTVVYLSSLCQHLYEVLSSGGTIRTFWNEQRKWMMASVTAILFGCLEFVMKWLGITKTKFKLTNKAVDEEKLKKYEKGKFNFEGAKMFMVPLATLIILNTVCLIGGVKGVIKQGNFEDMFGQVFLSSIVVLLGFSILEGLIPSKGK